MRKLSMRCAAVAALTALGACTQQSGKVGDSGAVVQRWELISEPRVTIGSVDGVLDDQLVGVAAAWMRPDGGAVVVDIGRPGILFFDSAGRFEYATGRRGKGPGEMQNVIYAWRYRADSIAIYDLMLRRLTIYDPSGNAARDFLNPITHTAAEDKSLQTSPCCVLRGSFEDGSFVALQAHEVSLTSDGDRYSRGRLTRVSPEGETVEPIGEFDWALYRHAPALRSGVERYPATTGFYAVHGQSLVVGHSLDSAISVLSANSSTAALRLPGQSVPFTAELQETYKSAMREELSTRGGIGYHGTLESNIPEHFSPTAPRYTDISVSEEGNYWLRRWVPRYGRMGGTQPYDILAPDGSYIGSIELSAEARVLWASAERVLLLERDHLDVQFVRLYDIAKMVEVAR
jgi:hypothetical protein